MWLELTRAFAKCRLLLPILFAKHSTHLFDAGNSVESDTITCFGVKYVALANVLAITSFHLILLAHFVYVYGFCVVWFGGVVAFEIPTFPLSVKFLEISMFFNWFSPKVV